MSAVVADTSSISCTCCCALSHGGTWQLPIRPYLRNSLLDAVVPHTRPSARRAARRYSACGELGGRQRDYVAIGRAQRPRRLEQRRRISWIDVDAPRQTDPRAAALAEVHDEKRVLEGVGTRPQRRRRLCRGRERVEQRLPTLDRQAGNGRRQRVLLRRRLGRHARYDVAQRTRLRGERRLRATR